jgi:protein involved in polysaccharide export with SLBB domain
MRIGTRMARLSLLATVALALLAWPAHAGAQSMDARGFQLTRQELQTMLERLEDAARPDAGYSRQIRQQAAREADMVRSRLELGDFRVGDRIELRVRGHDQLSGAVVVEAGPLIKLPEIGDISLEGVLRSELREHLTRELSRYLRNPEVATESLIRLGIMGQVNSPGFMVLPASMLLEDALMAAGGPARDADLSAILVHRGDERVWDGGSLQDALVHGFTLDQLSLRAGDRIEVPRQSPGLFSWSTARIVLVTVPSMLWGLRRIGVF